MIRKIGIVGAGFGGLSAARVFKSLNYDVTVFDKEAEVGGVWTASRRYPGLTTQNPRSTYALSDYPMPADYPEWPSGEQVQAYMQAYTEAFDFADDIQLNTEVVHAGYDDHTQQWQLDLKRTDANGQCERYSERFDYLIIANGIFSVPSIPQYPGADEFTAAGGRICHTSQFNSREAARGKHVLVIGYGKSSCDVANAIADISASTTVVARNLIWKLPKRLANVLNYKHLFLTRLSEALFRYIRLEGADKFFHTWGNPLRQAMLGSVQFVIEKQTHLKSLGLHPQKPLETIARSTVSLVTDGFYEKIRAGRIRVAKNSEIVRLHANTAELSNGETVPADIIVCGTGWRQVCPFLDPDIMAKVTDEQGNFRLYRSMLPIGVPRLAFNGYNSSFFSQLNCEVGALWLADYLNGGVSLPAIGEQHRYADERLAWMEARTDGKHSKGTNIIPFSIHHIDELLNDMGMNLGAATRFKQWFGALDPRDYAGVLPRLQEKHRRHIVDREQYDTETAAMAGFRERAMQ
ncbi:flavin-containing monooxygenase [Parahaliea mediterranea]|uniref:NAD(P)/FAD-dependent oxidoreductase n=1 Tax=Parahaliea mediterranea TaxID=651086 RepID=A0A939IMD1_9GAMM|nr:NAD(P)/FAD-dependent oxidoreductase [Parahaliea mediterranea]MBN7797385.1 NAD(P)/FAD-dependent oxidoreductase [Parahaliea mediterranea]